MFKIILSLIGVNILLGGTLTYQIFTNTKRGPDAIAAISEDQKPHLKKFKQLHHGMSFEKSKQIFGTPTEVKNTDLENPAPPPPSGGSCCQRRPPVPNTIFVLVARWQVNGSNSSTIQAVFANDKLIRARWLHVGYFEMEL